MLKSVYNNLKEVFDENKINTTWTPYLPINTTLHFTYIDPLLTIINNKNLQKRFFASNSIKNINNGNN